MWLEIISIRHAWPIRAEVESTIFDLAESVRYESGVERVVTYSRSDNDTDVTLHIQHNTKPTDQLSSIGLNAVEVLREFGSIDHSVWLPIQPAQPPKASPST